MEKNLLFEEWYENGQKEFEEKYNFSRDRVGEWTKWYKNGQVESIQRYNDRGDLDGKQLEYYQDGTMLGRQHYKNDKKDGLQEAWDSYGNIQSRVNYKDGKKDGIEELFYHHDMFHPEREVPNVARERTEYKDGKENGISEKFYSNGRLSNYAELRDGLANGACVNWGSDGQLIDYREYKDGSSDGFFATPTPTKGEPYDYCEIRDGYRVRTIPAEEGEKMLSERMKSVEEKIAKANEGSGDVLFREEEEGTAERAERRRSAGMRAVKAVEKAGVKVHYGEDEMQNDKVLHLNNALPFSSESYLTEAPQEEGPDLVPTSDNFSEGKDNNNFGTTKENGEKNGENLLFREEEPRGIRRALIYGKDRRTGEDRYVDYSRTGDDVRAMEREVAQGIKEQYPELKLSSADHAQETNSIYRTITFPNGSALRIRFSDHTPGMTARELDDSRSNYNGINWTFTVKDNDKVSGLIDLSRNRMTADDVMRFVGRMAEYDRDGYPEEMQRLIEENKEKIRSEHRGWLAPVYYADERITKAFGEDVAPLGNEEGLRFREEDEGTRPRGPLRPGEGIFDRAEAVSRDYMAELERVRKSREEAKAERPKEEREYIQAQEVKRRVDAVLEKLKNITAEHKQDEELTRRAVKALNGEMLALVNDNTPTDDPNYIEIVLLSNLVADYCDENYAMTPPTLVEMIKLRMYEMGLTQVALSKLLGINTSRISEYLNGKKMPTLSHARTISQKLDISPSIVLGV